MQRECNKCCPPDYKNHDTVIKKENMLHCMMIHVFFTALAPAMPFFFNCECVYIYAHLPLNASV